MRYTYTAFAALLCLSAPLAAQNSAVSPLLTTAAPDPAVTAIAAPIVDAAPKPLVLAANTDIIVGVDTTLTSKNKKMKIGDKFKFSTVLDVMSDGQLVIPKGTPGEGTVTFTKGSGSFGKAGKLEVAFNSLNLNGRQIALTGRFREEGKGNGGAAVGAVVAAGVIAGIFVKGHSAEIVKGQQLHAHTAEALTI
ncbi:MAG: hypothetical protein ABIQ66_10480 [Novosphingobium sp.]